MVKLICFDMDGVIFEHANFWMELHKKYNTYKEGLELTEKHLKTNYSKLVQEVVGRLWKGKPESIFLELVNSIKYIQGAHELLKWLKNQGYKIAIISAGPKRLAQRAQKELGVDYIYTNELIFRDGIVTGEFKWPIASDRKAVTLRRLCEEHKINLKDCIVVCHDHADIKMAKIAGFTIGFCPEDEELKKYCNVVINKKDLCQLIPLLKDFETKREIFINLQ